MASKSEQSALVFSLCLTAQVKQSVKSLIMLLYYPFLSSLTLSFVIDIVIIVVVLIIVIIVVVVGTVIIIMIQIGAGEVWTTEVLMNFTTYVEYGTEGQKDIVQTQSYYSFNKLFLWDPSPS